METVASATFKTLAVEPGRESADSIAGGRCCLPTFALVFIEASETFNTLAGETGREASDSIAGGRCCLPAFVFALADLDFDSWSSPSPSCGDDRACKCCRGGVLPGADVLTGDGLTGGVLEWGDKPGDPLLDAVLPAAGFTGVCGEPTRFGERLESRFAGGESPRSGCGEVARGGFPFGVLPPTFSLSETESS